MCLALVAGGLPSKALTPKPVSGCPLVMLPAWCTLWVALLDASGGAVPALDCHLNGVRPCLGAAVTATHFSAQLQPTLKRLPWPLRRSCSWSGQRSWP